MTFMATNPPPPNSTPAKLISSPKRDPPGLSGLDGRTIFNDHAIGFVNLSKLNIICICNQYNKYMLMESIFCHCNRQVTTSRRGGMCTGTAHTHSTLSSYKNIAGSNPTVYVG